jgi:RNA polymerase sigma factor (sigma-70 family)
VYDYYLYRDGIAMQVCGKTLEALRTRLRFKVSYHLGSQCPDIDDIVQETMSRVLESAANNKIRNPDSLGAFASSTCTNIIREYRRRVCRDAPLDAADPVQDSRQRADDAAEIRDLVQRTLETLSDRDRELLHAFYIEEMPVQQIAARQGLTESAFRVALFRARERFRQIFDNRVKPFGAETH